MESAAAVLSLVHNMYPLHLTPFLRMVDGGMT